MTATKILLGLRPHEIPWQRVLLRFIRGGRGNVCSEVVVVLMCLLVVVAAAAAIVAAEVVVVIMLRLAPASHISKQRMF